MHKCQMDDRCSDKAMMDGRKSCMKVESQKCHQYFNVSSVRLSVCACVTDVTSPNEPGLRENTREDCDVIV